MLTVVFGVLFFWCLGRSPLANPDEGRYAEIPREMVASGDWVSPRLNGVAYFEKPPLVYWCVALCHELFGPGERSMRTTPALFALAGVLLLYLGARHIFGQPAALFAASVLGSTILYFALGRILLLDMAVSIFISATLLFFILGVRETGARKRRAFFYGLYLSAALATLSKGLIGFLLPGAVMFLWLLVFNQWRRLRPLYLPSGLLLALIVAVPWHVLAAQRNPTWAHFYFVHEHWERFSTSAHARVQPWWFFIPIVVFGFFPWSAFLPGALRVTLGDWGRRKENADVWFFAVWAGFVFLFFSASQSKLPPYILPVFPPLAVLIGVGLTRDAAKCSAWVKAGVVGFLSMGGVLAVAILLVVFRPHIARIDVAQAGALQPFAIIMAAILVVGGYASLWFIQKKGLPHAMVALLTTTGLFLGTLALAGETIQRAGTRDLARYVSTTLPRAARVFHYHDFFHDFVFYARRFVATVEYHGDELELMNDPVAREGRRFIGEDAFRRIWTGSERIYVVVRKKKLRDLRRDYDAARAETVMQTGGSDRGIMSQKRPSVLIDPTIITHVLRETADHYLITNRGD